VANAFAPFALMGLGIWGAGRSGVCRFDRSPVCIWRGRTGWRPWGEMLEAWPPQLSSRAGLCSPVD